MANNKEDCIRLLQAAVNLLYASQEWEGVAHMKAQKLGLQGEKRRERYEQRKELCIMQYLQSVAIDLFDVEIMPARQNVNFPQVTDIQSYFNQYLAKLWEIYEGIHSIANELVVKNYKAISEPLYEYACCLFKEIIDTRRTIKEGTIANWEFHHVSRYQVSMKENVHDKFEGKEEQQGYKY